MFNNRVKKIPPYIWIILSFFSVIVFGGLLLSLPISTISGKGTKLIDGLFMATSAICVTGLAVLDISMEYTFFGKFVLMILIQIGALGVVTISSFLVLIFSKKIGYYTKKIVQEDMNAESIFKIQAFLKRVILTVFFIEGIGSIFLFLHFIKDFKFTDALFYSIFHSVSAFSNAGFTLFSDNLASFTGNILINITISTLVILGGLGFATLMNIYDYKIKGKDKRFTLNTKIVLKMSIFLLILGTVVTFILEYNNMETMGNLSMWDKLLASFFQSMTTRTAGFNTISIKGLHPSTAFFYTGLMFVGASPGSTGGGIKTTTIGIIFLGIKSILLGTSEIEMEDRSVSWELFHRAIVIVIVSIIYMSGILFLMVVIENRVEFIDLLFEVVSAFGTAGLSRDLTPLLKDSSKFLIMITMFVGRVGPLTVALSLSKELLKVNKYKYPKENILIG